METGADSRALPWPSDALLGDDGKLHVVTPLPFDSNVEANLTQLAASLSEADGFATTRSIFFPVERRRRRSTMAPRRRWSISTTPPRRWSSRSSIAPTRSSSSPWRRSARRSLEHHAYGCYIAGGVHDAARPHAASVVDDGDGHRAATARSARRRRIKKLAAALDGAKSVKPLAATAFTTQTLTAWAQKAPTDLAAMPPVAPASISTFTTADDLDDIFGGPATTTKPGRPPSGGVMHDNVAAVVVGHLRLAALPVADAGHARPLRRRA